VRMVLTEGRNRQIRRMWKAVGYRVITLHRLRIMHITLAGLPSGAWTPLTPREQQELLRAVLRTP
jgi:23S rRNA pseudouridine2604 synthase